jgi:hypothetical protein
MRLSNNPGRAAAQASRLPHEHPCRAWTRNLYPAPSTINARRRCDHDEDSRRAVENDPVVHMARAALELFYTIFPSGDCVYISGMTLYRLIVFNIELNYEVITYGRRARINELRLNALDDIRQLLRALENHRPALSRQ